MNIPCEQIEELIDLQTAGWLSEEQAATLEQHLNSCPACLEQAQASNDVAGLLAACPAAPAPVIDVASFTHPVSAGKPWKWLVATASAACLLLVLRTVPSTPESPALAGVAELSEAPPTLATYRLAANLSDDDLEQVLDAHDRNSPLYEPPMTLMASRNKLEGLLL